MSKSLNGPVSAKVIRAAFQNGDLDPTAVQALKPNPDGPGWEGAPRTDKDGNPVLASTACIFGANGDGKVRGRLNPAFVRVFLDANPDATYAEKSGAEAATVEVPLVKRSKTGARLKRPERLPVAEVRALAGVSGQKGRLSSASLLKAAEAIQAQRGW